MKTKKTISVVLFIIMLLPGSMFHSAVIALVLALMWKVRLKEFLITKWKYGYRMLVGVLTVLSLILMPRPFALPSDRVRLMYLDENYNRITPPLHHWLINILLPEETLFTLGLTLPFSPLRSALPIGEGILKDFDIELKNMKLHKFFTTYNSLAFHMESPLSGAYAQGSEIVGEPPTRTAYIIRPKHYDSSKTYPVVFFAHGFLGNFRLFPALLNGFEDKIVVVIGTKDLSGIYRHSDINAIFTHYLPMLEELGFNIDRKELSLLGLSNGGSAIDVAYSGFSNRFKNLVYISTGVNNYHHTRAKIMVIGGGKDHCALSMRKGMKRLKANGQKSSHLFIDDATHLMMITEKDRVMDFLNTEL